MEDGDGFFYRPLFECYVRGVWLLNVAIDEEVDKFLSGKSHFKISTRIEAIENCSETDGEWIKATKTAYINVMNNLTHGGTSHILQRCSSNTIEPRYPEIHLISWIELGIEVKIRTGAEILAKLQNEEVMIFLNEKDEYARSMFQFICPKVSK